MEKLFSKTEYESLLKAASWSDEDTTSAECAWMEELKKLSMYFCARQGIDGMPDGDVRRVFFSAFWPLIEETVRKLCAGRGVDWDGLFAPGALRSYETGFMEYCIGHWASVCAGVFREAGYSPFRLGENPDAVRYIDSGRCFHDVCLRYPMFARLFTEYLISVKHELAELAELLYANRETVYIRLCDPQAGERAVPLISNLSGPVSDRHSGGRSVHIITFADGKKVVYKPHSSRMDLAFAGWLDFLAELSGEERFETADTVDFGAFSFYRFVSPHAFQSIEETVRFFYREGFLLGAVYSLCGRDLHSENIIAARDPVIVDSESLVEALDADIVSAYSILSTTMLPLCSSRPAYHKEPSGACDSCKGDANLPVLDERIYSAYDFPDEMIAGFTAAMNTIIKNKPAAMDIVRRLFCGVITRKLIHPTYAYEYTLLAINSPRRLGSASEAEHVMNILLERKTEKDSETAQREARIRLERDAMRRLDIPILYVTLDEEAIAKVTARMETLDARALEQPLKFMQFLLNKNNSMRRPYVCKEHDSADNAALRTLAEQTLESFNGLFHIAVPRETGEPCIAMGGAGFMEGKLGAAVALAGYLSVADETDDALCERIRRELRDYLDSLAKRKDSRKAFSVMEPGLAEGMGGMLSGAYLLFRFGLIDDTLFTAVAEGILHSTEQALDAGRIFSFSQSFLYGFNGLQYAMERICALGGLNAALIERMKNTASRLGKQIVYPEEMAEEMLRAELKEAHLRFDSAFIADRLSLPFPGLFFGTAGKLFRLCGERSRRFYQVIDPLFDFFHYNQGVL